MLEIINEIIKKLNTEIKNFFLEDNVSVDNVEEYFEMRICDAVLKLTAAYYEQKDLECLNNKTQRKREGLVVERRNERRAILTKIGLLEYQRTYYQKTGTDNIEYVYPVDKIAGIDSRQRLSNSICASLVEQSIKESYQKSSEHITNGRVSRQTVMNKIRSCSPVYEVPQTKKQVSVLHIDADEDHVSLQNGKKTIVPLISVYEGIEKVGNRGICKNIFHISKYDKKCDEIWEYALGKIEEIYDLTNTKIYLHGDGAAWIKEGLEWLPNSCYCLDKYHANKYYKKATTGMAGNDCVRYQKELKDAIKSGNKDEIIAVQGEMISNYPSNGKTIIEATNYLYDNFNGIEIYQNDIEALNGGATEPHISHILSSRLSSRPMGWSAKTLKKFVPILASRSFSFAQHSHKYNRVVQDRTVGVKNFVKNSLGLPHPDITVGIANGGKVTPLSIALTPYFRGF